MKFENARGTEVVEGEYGWEFADNEKEYQPPFHPSDCDEVAGKKCFNIGTTCNYCIIMYER